MPSFKPLQHMPQEPPPPSITSAVPMVSASKKERKSTKKANSTTHMASSLPKPTGLRGGLAGKNKAKPQAADVVQATAVPDPIPAEGPTTIKLKPNAGTTLSIPPTADPMMVTEGPNPVVPALAISSVISTTTVWATPTLTSIVSSTASMISSASSSAESSRRLPVYVIVLLAFGSTSLAITAFSLVMYLCHGKRRVSFPTPSAPILQDSPLFGGKERLSRGLWADPSFGNLRLPSHKSASLFRSSKGDGWRPLHNTHTQGGLVSDSESEKTLRVPETAMINEKFAISSPSLAASTLPPTPSAPVGVALETPAHAPVINQPLRPTRKDVPTASKAKRMSMVASMYGGAEVTSPTFTETMIAYQTPRPAPSPGKAKSALKPSANTGTAPRTQGSSLKKSNSGSQGRAAGNNPRRHSVTRTEKEKEGDLPSSSFLYSIPSVKSQERRDRDTKALTSALGLASPPLKATSTMDNSNNNGNTYNTTSCFSPVSIYPEDSLSMKRRTSVYRSEMPSPTSMSAALGSFMLQDYPSTATFASFKSTNNNGNGGDPFANPVETIVLPKKKVSQDKPPRVPSPPPLPSLAQMALANADPDYRSPTYSIYGYYDSQRKSKASFATDMI